MKLANDAAIAALVFLLVIAMFSPVAVYSSYGSVAIAATAGLFALPVIFLLLIALVIVVKRHSAVSEKRIKQPHYSWEKLFVPHKQEEVKLERPERSRGFGDRVIIAVLLIIALVLLIILSPAVKNILGPDTLNQTISPAKISISQQQPKAAVVQQPVQQLPIAGNFSIGSIVDELKLPVSVLRYAGVSLLVLLLVSSFAYSHRSVDLSHVPEWFGVWAAAIRKNAARLAIIAVLSLAIILAFSFRKMLNLNGIFAAFVSFLVLYRTYFLAGVASLIVVLSFLVSLEKKRDSKS